MLLKFIRRVSIPKIIGEGQKVFKIWRFNSQNYRRGAKGFQNSTKISKTFCFFFNEHMKHEIRGHMALVMKSEEPSAHMV